jgi:Mrp family chromosome partitioning ATPase
MGLAAALAHGGARVMLVEADLRKPTFATTFQLKRFAGIESVLSGKTSVAKAAVSVTVEDISFQVLAAHTATSKGADLPFTVVEKLITDAKALADFVVIDSAPLTAVIDALPFAQAADEVVIATRLGHTRLSKLDELDELLAEHDVKRTGIVLIGEHPARGVEYYYAPDTNGVAEPAPVPEGNGVAEPDLRDRESRAPTRSRRAARGA